MDNLQRKNELYELIDELPERQFSVVKTFMEFVIMQSQGKDDFAIIRAFNQAPEDEEFLSEEDRRVSSIFISI